MTPGRIRELWEELKLVLTGRATLIDTLMPPLVYLLLYNAASATAAVAGALALASTLAVLRLVRKQPLRYALGGAAGVGLAAAVAWGLGRAEGFFLPGLLSGGLTAAGCLVSVLLRRPLVAWTSHFTRGWPRSWYWHPRVRPAYSEVTLAWALFFGGRTLLQWWLFQNQAAGELALVQLLGGWPALVTLLIASYLYGLWRLQNLGGPSVAEFKAGAAPPWRGQRRGF